MIPLALCSGAVYVALEFLHPAGQRWRLTRLRLVALGWIAGMVIVALGEARP